MSSPPLDGGVILLTGASAGIGRELARQLAPRARALILVARRADRLEALRDELVQERPELIVEVAPCDLGDAAAVERLLAALEARGPIGARTGPVDVLINNAGFGDFTVFDHSDWRKAAEMLQVNIVTLTALAHRLIPGMVARKKGGVLNISSSAGLSFVPGFAVYCGTKHYVTGFTEALRLDLLGTGVAVTQVCPGPVATEFVDVAGNPTGRKPPAFVELSADKCARQALRAFARGRALVVTGFWMKLLMLFAALAPRWLHRLTLAPLARIFRRIQLRKLAAPPAAGRAQI